MSRRALAAVALALAAGAAGCGGEGDDASSTAKASTGEPAGLIWNGTPTVFAPDGLPTDKILTGSIRNAAGRPVDLRVDRVDVQDAEGRSLGANVRFVSSFGHGLYGPGGPPAPLQASLYDQERLGERLTLEPNADRPVTVAWRTAEGRGPATSVIVSGFTLKLP